MTDLNGPCLRAPHYIYSFNNGLEVIRGESWCIIGSKNLNPLDTGFLTDLGYVPWFSTVETETLTRISACLSDMIKVHGLWTRRGCRWGGPMYNWRGHLRRTMEKGCLLE